MSVLHQTRRLLVYVEDLSAAIRFYRDALGFTPTVGVEGVNQEFETSGAPLVLHRGGTAVTAPRGLNGVVPSFTVADIQATVARLEAAGVQPVLPLQAVSHGWIYFFADPEGNTFQVYQPKAEDGR